MSAGGIRNSGNSGLRVQIDTSRTRQTAKTDFGSVMKTGLSKGADAVLQAGQLAAPFIPGGAVLSAAITGVGSLKQTMGASGAGSAGGGNAAHASIGGGVGGTGSTSGSSGGAFADLEAQAASGNSGAQQLLATKQMQEMNQSFNLQYLQLQQKMQGDNRQFTALSNIMKTKHDTAKNAIGNIR